MCVHMGACTETFSVFTKVYYNCCYCHHKYRDLLRPFVEVSKFLIYKLCLKAETQNNSYSTPNIYISIYCYICTHMSIYTSMLGNMDRSTTYNFQKSNDSFFPSLNKILVSTSQIFYLINQPLPKLWPRLWVNIKHVACSL